jgi:hypothetical protein
MVRILREEGRRRAIGEDNQAGINTSYDTVEAGIPASAK